MSAINRVYVYATLKHKGIREQALGSDARTVRVVLAVVRDFREVNVVIGTEQWPSLEADPGTLTQGDVLFVSDHDLDRLCQWEAKKYTKLPIVVEDWGLCWVFMLQQWAHKPGSDGQR